MNDCSTNNGEHGLDALDLLFGDGEVIVRESDKVGQLTGSKRAFLAALAGKPTAALGVESQRLLAAETILAGIQGDSADCLASHQPVKGDPWVVAGHTRGVGASAYRDTKLQHSSNGRGSFDSSLTIALNEVFTLVGHAMLDRDAAAERP